MPKAANSVIFGHFIPLKTKQISIGALPQIKWKSIKCQLINTSFEGNLFMKHITCKVPLL